MSFKLIESEDLEFFNKILGGNYVVTDPEKLEENSHDETEDLSFFPQVILLPHNTAEIQKVLSYCNENNICVTPRGAGTGLSGGSIPFNGGVSLDMKRMNRIINIDEENFQVITQPGVITEELQNAVEEKGLFYPVDPASRGSCFIGGNVAENSGGPRAVKYGTVKDYVLGLEIVLSDGRIIRTGTRTLKDATGYDITHLIVGSEGTLAVITEITLKLIPLPKKRLLMAIPFTSEKNATKAVNVILKMGLIPSALEFMEREALRRSSEFLKETSNYIEIPERIEAHLLVEVDGNDIDDLYNEAEIITEAISSLTEEDISVAELKQEQDKLWKLRRVIGEAVKMGSFFKEMDTVVPRSVLPELLGMVKKIGEKYGFKTICYGHAGDGNLHVNILKKGLTDQEWSEEVPKGIKEIFRFVVEMGGTISAEHGIGLVQKKYIPIVFSTETINLMKSIKNIFDAKGILNPGKIWPD